MSENVTVPGAARGFHIHQKKPLDVNSQCVCYLQIRSFLRDDPTAHSGERKGRQPGRTLLS